MRWPWTRRHQDAEDVPPMLATVRVLRFELEERKTDEEINAAVDCFIVRIGAKGGRTMEPVVRVSDTRLTFVFPVVIPLESLLPNGLTGRNGRPGMFTPPPPPAPVSAAAGGVPGGEV